jgi:hypothetical protein
MMAYHHGATIIDGESLPLQPKPPYLHRSMQGLTEITRVGLVFRESSPSTSQSSPERAARRSPTSLSGQRARPVSRRGREGPLRAVLTYRPGPVAVDSRFIFVFLYFTVLNAIL